MPGSFGTAVSGTLARRDCSHLGLRVILDADCLWSWRGPVAMLCAAAGSWMAQRGWKNQGCVTEVTERVGGNSLQLCPRLLHLFLCPQVHRTSCHRWCCSQRGLRCLSNCELEENHQSTWGRCRVPSTEHRGAPTTGLWEQFGYRSR